MATRATARVRHAVCVDNSDYPSSLERKKIYEVLSDPDAEAHGQVRVIDESGEDYLFPAAYFEEVRLRPKTVTRLFGKGPKPSPIRLNTRAAVQRSLAKSAGREASKRAPGKRR